LKKIIVIAMSLLVGCAHTTERQIASEPAVAPKVWVPASGWDPAARYDDVHFINDKVGFAVSASGKIYRTANQGSNWRSVFQAPSGVYLRTIDFLDDGKVGFVGALSRDQFYQTIDGGKTWSNISDKLPGHHSICGLDHFGSVLFAVGNYQITSAQFFRSIDGGNSWELIDLGHLASGLIDVKFVSPKTGFIAGTHKDKGAVILRTNNGGTTWSQVYPDPRAQTFPTDPGDIVWKLDFVNESVAYGAIYSSTASDSRIVKTIDGGRTWQTLVVDSKKNWELEGIGFIDENTGWTGGYGKGSLMTRDGGNTWVVRSDGANFNRLFFIRPGLGIAAGAGLFKLTTAESGRGTASQISVQIPHSAQIKKNSVCMNLDKNTHATVRTMSGKGAFIDTVALAHQPYKKGQHCFDPQKIYALADGEYYLQFRTHERIFAKNFALKNKKYFEVSRLPASR
jgi:photosystem II stability/assembly factor-like uncharacterized protein